MPRCTINISYKGDYYALQQLLNKGYADKYRANGSAHLIRG